MAPTFTLPFLTLTLTALILTASTAARDLPVEPGLNLTVRLEAAADGGLVECWNALTEIRSCSNEIVLFFMNGSTNIGPACCDAVGLVTHHCWPAMLTTLGFTPEETNVLRGYCDFAASASGGPAQSPTDQALPPPPAATLVVV